jgi:hypothetical protein
MGSRLYFELQRVESCGTLAWQKCKIKQKNKLFWVISGVGKYTWVESSRRSIKTFHDEAMLIRCNELVVQQDIPNLMHEFSAAMGHNRALLASWSQDVLNGVWNL